MDKERMTKLVSLAASFAPLGFFGFALWNATRPYDEMFGFNGYVSNPAANEQLIAPASVTLQVVKAGGTNVTVSGSGATPNGFLHVKVTSWGIGGPGGSLQIQADAKGGYSDTFDVMHLLRQFGWEGGPVEIQAFDQTSGVASPPVTVRVP